MQLDPRPLPSPWTDKVTLIPQSVENRGSLIAALDFIGQIAENIGDRDKRIFRTSLRKGPQLYVPNVIRNSYGDYVDLHVKTFPIGKGTSLRVSAINLTVDSKLWAAIAPHEVNILAHGMMFSDVLREITRVLRPLSVDATALLAEYANGKRLDHTFLTMVGKVMSADKAIIRDLSRDIGDSVLSSTSLKSLVRSSANLSSLPSLEGKPRVHIERYYHSTLSPHNGDIIEPDLIPSQIRDFGHYAFVEQMKTSNFVDLITMTEILNPFINETFDMMDIMEAIRMFAAIKDANTP